MVSLAFSSLVTLVGALAVSALPSKVKRADTPLPDYAITYAPLSYLYSKESYFPSDIAVHIQHVIPEVNFTAINPTVTLANVSSYGSDVYLTAMDSQSNSASVDWMTSVYGKPDSNGAAAAAPATIIAVEKANNTVDVFYFYFYSYDFGNTVLDLVWGNHVGDWEHSMVRFVDGQPQYFYLSAHSGGSAYNYSAVEKTNNRPTSYIGTGTHANYATAGEQDYTLPFGLLHDTTDKGTLWDVTQNYRGFWYDTSSQKFTSAGGAGSGGSAQDSEGVSWLSFSGAWGDAQWPTSRSGQYCVSTECHYVGGPTGPLAKNLGRTAICQNESDCTIRNSV